VDELRPQPRSDNLPVFHTTQEATGFHFLPIQKVGPNEILYGVEEFFRPPRVGAYMQDEEKTGEIQGVLTERDHNMPQGYDSFDDNEAIESLQKDRRIQVGGDHYTKRAIQPFDVIREYGMDFFEGNALKYLLRWKDKGGIEDLEKAMHYIAEVIANTERSNG
jgi:hypothetical protein